MQNRATLRNALRKRNYELPSVSNDMQSSETLGNSLGLNYKSAALNQLSYAGKNAAHINAHRRLEQAGNARSVRVKLDTFPLSNDVGLLNRYEPFAQREYIVFLRQSDHKIVFNIDAGDGVHAAGVASGTAASLGTWYHVAGGWDGANIELAVNNGILVTAAYSRAMINGGDNFKLGYGAQSLDGKMDEFGFWISRSLTQQK